MNTDLQKKNDQNKIEKAELKKEIGGDEHLANQPHFPHRHRLRITSPQSLVILSLDSSTQDIIM